MKKHIILTLTLLSFAALIALSVLLSAKNPVHLVYMSDKKYLPYMMVSLHSAIINKNKNTSYHVHVLAKDLTNEDIKKLKELEQADVQISVCQTKELNLDSAHLGRFASFAPALQKVFIAGYLKNINKVLYLDADTIVQKDLTSVYNTNLDNQYIAAVKDGLMYQFPEHIAELGLKERDFYFNSGVMLLNLKEIRERNIERRAVTYFNTHNEIFGDQDILNVVVGQKVLPLSYVYNVNSTFFEEKSAAFLAEFYQEKVPNSPKEVYDNAAILHFAGHKPWTPWFNQPYLQALWENYAKKTQAKYQIMF